MGAAPDSFTSSVRAIPHQLQSSGSQDRRGSIVWMVQVGQPWFAHRDPALLESREEDLLCPRLRNLSRGQGRCTSTALACPAGWQRGAWLTGVVEVQQQGLVSAALAFGSIWEPAPKGLVKPKGPSWWQGPAMEVVAEWTDRLFKENSAQRCRSAPSLWPRLCWPCQAGHCPSLAGCPLRQLY